MANDVRLGDAAANAAVNAIVDLLNGGKLQIYDGTRPATGDTAVGAQHKLAEFTLPTPAFGDAADGVATANAITAVTALATYTATWFRVLQSDDTKMFDGEVGTSGCDLNLNTAAIVADAEVSISSFTVILPQS